ncbi:MAG: hypothetical protein KC613_10745, partial [Myxococcales bacterium]|nr:hypothetical protein [Myxococcales bacterium]
MHHLLTVLALLAVPPPAPVGDGSALGVALNNPGVHPVTVAVGAADEPALEGVVPGYAEQALRVQCAARGAEGVPALVARVGDRELPLVGQPIAFPDGPPALWISGALQGRAALAEVVAGVRPGLALVHLEPKAVPHGFEALRFAPLIIVDGITMAALDPAARRAVQGAVAAGAVLVLAMGAADAPAAALDGFIDARPGETGSVGPALGAVLPQATSVRPLPPGPGAAVRLKADGHAVVVARAYGLGEVRAVGVALTALGAGAVARAALGEGPDGFGQALGWLERAPPLGDGAGVRWSVWAWASLLVIPLLGLVYRRWPRVAVALAAPGWLAAVWAPPVDEALGVDAERVLVLPLDEAEALAVGTVDITLGIGGGRTLAVGLADVALEDARPQGACLMRMGEQSAFVVQGEPGGRRRLSWLARIPRPTAGAAEGTLPAWPPGPLAGGALRALPPDAVPAVLARPARSTAGWL